MNFDHVKKGWRYQRGNQKPKTKERHTIQPPNEKTKQKETIISKYKLLFGMCLSAGILNIVGFSRQRGECSFS